ncbi:MAG: hypothetical protein R3B41_01665 [Candidatus Doudnabacteria bacterium]
MEQLKGFFVKPDALFFNTHSNELHRDSNELDGCRAILIGPESRKGHGSGGKKEHGEQAWDESEADIISALEPYDQIIFVFGLGGGTGLGCAGKLAEYLCQDNNSLKGKTIILTEILPDLGFDLPKQSQVKEQHAKIKKSGYPVLLIDQAKQLDLALQINQDVGLKEFLERNGEQFARIISVISSILLDQLNTGSLDRSDLHEILQESPNDSMGLYVGVGSAVKVDSSETTAQVDEVVKKLWELSLLNLTSKDIQNNTHRLILVAYAVGDIPLVLMREVNSLKSKFANKPAILIGSTELKPNDSNDKAVMGLLGLKEEGDLAIAMIAVGAHYISESNDEHFQLPELKVEVGDGSETASREDGIEPAASRSTDEKKGDSRTHRHILKDEVAAAEKSADVTNLVVNK